MTTAQTGSFGERAAVEELRRRGFELLHLNWRSGRYELDIVARQGETLHFVEVKTRRADGLTQPEMAATPTKFRALCIAAQRYMDYVGWDGEVQFDLAAVDLCPDGSAEVRLIERAMEANW